MSRRSNPTRTSKLAVSRLFTVDALALVEVSRVDVDESYDGAFEVLWGAFGVELAAGERGELTLCRSFDEAIELLDARAVDLRGAIRARPEEAAHVYTRRGAFGRLITAAPLWDDLSLGAHEGRPVSARDFHVPELRGDALCFHSYAPAPLDGHGRGPAVFRHRVELATLRAGPPERIPLAPR